jgi:putative ABC transport system ATP-binding protein
MFKWFKRRKTSKSNSRYKHGNDYLIELRDVVKTYEGAAGKFTALKDINLQVDPGEFVAVMGKSGSGKSTLINMITGIDRPTSGEVLVGDTAVHKLSEGQVAVWRGKNVGVVFQFFQLLPTLTVVENIMLPMDFCDMYAMREREERAMHLLEQVNMTEHARKLPTAISGGQQQRVAIARALANEPPILVADEPTGNLDSVTAESIFALFSRQIENGKTILVVTHDVDLAQRASRTVVLVDGEIVRTRRTRSGIQEALGNRAIRPVSSPQDQPLEGGYA